MQQKRIPKRYIHHHGRNCLALYTWFT